MIDRNANILDVSLRFTLLNKISDHPHSHTPAQASVSAIGDFWHLWWQGSQHPQLHIHETSTSTAWPSSLTTSVMVSKCSTLQHTHWRSYTFMKPAHQQHVPAPRLPATWIMVSKCSTYNTLNYALMKPVHQQHGPAPRLPATSIMVSKCSTYNTLNYALMKPAHQQHGPAPRLPATLIIIIMVSKCSTLQHPQLRMHERGT